MPGASLAPSEPSVVLPKCLARQAVEAYIGVYGYHNEEVETATG